MGSVFSKPKEPDPVPIPDPLPIIEEDTGEEVKKLKKRKGRLDTILTGDLVPTSTGSTLLSGRL